VGAQRVGVAHRQQARRERRRHVVGDGPSTGVGVVEEVPPPGAGPHHDLHEPLTGRAGHVAAEPDVVRPAGEHQTA
jgi:hypothetical protein